MIVTLLKITLVAEEPFAVGASEMADAVDQPIAKDSDGNVYVPASSLAGSLRHHLRAMRLDQAMLGPDAEEAPSASPVRFLGAVARIEGSPIGRGGTTVRGQTAVDRIRGAAFTGSLRHTEAAPAGTTITLYLRRDALMSNEWLEALASWVPSVGGGRTSGMGRARLEAIAYGQLDLADPADLGVWLRRHGPDLVEHVATQRSVKVSAMPPAPSWSFTFRVVDALFVGGERIANATHAYRRDQVPVIEGSSLKGILRSRAEFILRSVGEDACAGGTAECGGVCRCCVLFGSAKRRAAISVRSAPVRDVTCARRDHVAIDRVTGGVAQGHLFCENDVVVAGKFDLLIDSLAKIEPWADALLRWVVQDLHDGLLGVGSGTTRGFGTVALVDPAIVGPCTPLAGVFKDGSAS